MIRATPHWRDDRLPLGQPVIIIASLSLVSWAAVVAIIWAALSIVAEALP